MGNNYPTLKHMEKTPKNQKKQNKQKQNKTKEKEGFYFPNQFPGIATKDKCHTLLHFNHFQNF